MLSERQFGAIDRARSSLLRSISAVDGKSGGRSQCFARSVEDRLASNSALAARLSRWVRPAAIRRLARYPHLECLEPRITPSTMTWTGTTSGQWMTAGNWSSDTVPQSGDDLVFPAGANTLNVVNNFPANTQFNTVTIQAPSYSLTGNPINLVSGIQATYSGVSNDAINTELENGIVGVSPGGTLNLEGAISGSAGLSLSGGGTLGLSGTNNFTGTTVVGSSTLLLRGTIGAVGK